MVRSIAKKAFSLLLCIFSTGTAFIQSCPTCIGRVTKTSPAFFKNVLYEDPSTKTSKSLHKSASKADVEKKQNALASSLVSREDQKI